MLDLRVVLGTDAGMSLKAADSNPDSAAWTGRHRVEGFQRVPADEARAMVRGLAADCRSGRARTITTMANDIGEMNMPTMLEKPEWLRANTSGKTGEIDREKGIIYGVILAEEGPFKSQGRGEFDRAAIRSIVSLAKAKNGGLKSRWTHPGLSSDGLGTFLGRYKGIRSDTVLRESGEDENGRPLMKEILVARGDLHFDQTALEEPVGGGKPYGIYVMDLAANDPDAFGTSLVLKANEEYRLDNQGKPLKDANGDDLPPLWIPTELHANDVVDEGDATHSFLSADILAGLPDGIVRQGCELLDAQFKGQTPEVIKARLSAFVDRYLAYRFGDEPEKTEASASGDTMSESQPAPVSSDDALALEMWLATERV